jgi:hypothetical protein
MQGSAGVAGAMDPGGGAGLIGETLSTSVRFARVHCPSTCSTITLTGLSGTAVIPGADDPQARSVPSARASAGVASLGELGLEALQPILDNEHLFRLELQALQ